MKIALPVHHFPPRYSAGAELYTFRLARELIRRGHTAEVICVERIDLANGSPITAEHGTYEGVPVWRLSLDLRHAPFAWSYANPVIGEWMARYLRGFAPDLVHLQSGYLMTVAPLEAAHMLQIPTLVTLHDFWFLCPRITLLRGDGSICTEVPADPAACGWCMKLESRRYRLSNQASGGLFGKAMVQLDLSHDRDLIGTRRRRLGDALELVDLALAPSQFLADQFAETIAPERLRVQRLGMETDRLQGAGQPSDEVLQIGYIGQIAPHKGVHVLIQAINLLPTAGRPVELTIYGNLAQNPGYTQELRQQIGSNPHIRLAGRFDNSRAAEVFAQFHATVVPSLWYENSPLVILEAHATGRPVLASAMGGMAELVRDEVDGLHFTPGDAADLARQIQRLRTEPGLLGRLLAGVRPPNSLDTELDHLEQSYQEILARRAGPLTINAQP